MQLTPEMEGENHHFKVEREKMGRRQVYVHLIVFTQFGMHQTELKKTTLSWETCCVCSKPTHFKKIASLCLRIMGGTMEHSREWQYTLVFGVCCGRCKPNYIKKFSTLVLRQNDLAEVEQFIDEQAFQGRCVEVENFLYGSRDDHGSVFYALMDNYLWRLNVINSQVPALCRRLSFKVNQCFFCKTTDALQKCDHCKCISHCSQPACVHKLERHHPALCLALSQGRLFHVDALMDRIFYVERSVAGRCLPYKPETLEMSEGEIQTLKQQHG